MRNLRRIWISKWCDGGGCVLSSILCLLVNNIFHATFAGGYRWVHWTISSFPNQLNHTDNMYVLAGESRAIWSRFKGRWQDFNKLAHQRMLVIPYNGTHYPSMADVLDCNSRKVVRWVAAHCEKRWRVMPHIVVYDSYIARPYRESLLHHQPLYVKNQNHIEVNFHTVAICKTSHIYK